VLLRDHLNKEDTVLPDIIDRSLSKEEDAMVVTEFTKNRPQAETIMNFARLENKYMRKPQETPVNSEREIARAQAGASSIANQI
jgi:hemerythrin-like domain-containing protein